MTGLTKSVMFAIKVHVDVREARSRAVHVTVVTPREKVRGESGEQEMDMIPEPSEAKGAGEYAET